MAKATHAQEVSTGTSDSYTDHELADVEAPYQVLVTRPDLSTVDKPRESKAEEVTSSAKADGGDSTQSSKNASTESTKLSQFPQQPAPTMENLSSQTEEEISDADSTDGNGQETEQPRSGSARKTPPTAARKSTTKTAPSRSRATMMGAEDDFAEFE